MVIHWFLLILPLHVICTLPPPSSLRSPTTTARTLDPNINVHTIDKSINSDNHQLWKHLSPPSSTDHIIIKKVSTNDEIDHQEIMQHNLQQQLHQRKHQDNRFRRSFSDLSPLSSSTSAASSFVEMPSIEMMTSPPSSSSGGNSIHKSHDLDSLSDLNCSKDDSETIRDALLRKILKNNQIFLSKFFPQTFRHSDPMPLQLLDINQLNSYWPRRGRREMMTPMSEEFAGMKIWKSVNLSGRREKALYANEPHYLVVRQNENNYPIGTEYIRDPFIPPRGRKDADDFFISKRDSRLDNLFGDSDSFVPNRGKKSPSQLKRTAGDDLLQSDELFFPNRGKKSFHDFMWTKRSSNLMDDIVTDGDLFFPNRGKKSVTATSLATAGMEEMAGSRMKIKKGSTLVDDLLSKDLFFPNRGRKRSNALNNKRRKRDIEIIPNDYPLNANEALEVEVNNQKNVKEKKPQTDVTRHKRNILNNLSQDNRDTFYSARGRKRFSLDNGMSDDEFRFANQPVFMKLPSTPINPYWSGNNESDQENEQEDNFYNSLGLDD